LQSEEKRPIYHQLKLKLLIFV